MEDDKKTADDDFEYSRRIYHDLLAKGSTRSKMIGRLIRFFLDNKGVKKNGKDKSS